MAAICQEVKLPDIFKKQVGKENIKETIFYHHLKDFKSEMKGFEKLEDIYNDDFRKAQPYMKDFCLDSCRMRTHQLRCRVNMPKLFGRVLWRQSCSTGPEDGPGGGPAPLES